METATKEPVMVDLLEKLGFTTASAKLKEKVNRKRKMAIAYEHYRFVRPEKFKEFNKKLKNETKTRGPYGNSWEELAFIGIQDYSGAPPVDVLSALEIANDRQCFDRYEVAYIREVEDPILFGVIEGCTDKFCVGQWDSDVKIEDILKANEG